MSKPKCSKAAGFTLIEIIAVLLILAVLAAVAVPRYLSLIDEATQKALDGALASGYSQLSMTYSQMLLQNGVTPSIANLTAPGAVQAPAGDYTYAFTAGTAANTINVNVTRTDGTGQAKDGTWTLP